MLFTTINRYKFFVNLVYCDTIAFDFWEKKMSKKLIIGSLTLILLFGSLTACSFNNPDITENKNFNSEQYRINGKVLFPAKFSVKASLNEVGTSASVSVIYPPD